MGQPLSWSARPPNASFKRDGERTPDRCSGAVLSSDAPEIVYRAAYILQQLRDGIMPDTPPEVAAELARYRAIHAEGKRSMVRRALQDGEFAAAGRFIRATGKAHLARLPHQDRKSLIMREIRKKALQSREFLSCHFGVMITLLCGKAVVSMSKWR